MNILRPYQLPQLQKPVQKALYAAIRKGDPGAVARCLSQGADPNAREVCLLQPSVAEKSGKTTEEGETPLLIAVGLHYRRIKDEARKAIVRLLLDKGASINRAVEAGFTPLIEAVRSYDYPIAQLLLQCGAKPDLQTEHGQTALTFAIHDGRFNFVEVLLSYGADVNGPPGSKGDTPLIAAVRSGSTEIVKLLLRRGANPNIRRDGWTAIEYATFLDNGENSSEVADLLKRIGAQGRSLAELKKETEQMMRKLEEERRKEDVKRQALARRYAKERIVTIEDAAVIEAVLQNLLTYSGRDLTVSQERNKTDILLVNKTMAGEPDSEPVYGDLSWEQDRDITRDMRENLTRRNYDSVLLAGNLPFRDPHLKIIPDIEVTPEALFNFWKTFPTARLLIHIHLPGYNSAHNRAVLSFAFSPTAHGAFGTIFLVKIGERWQVAWRKFTYFA